jgi:hypothetical protein
MLIVISALSLANDLSQGTKRRADAALYSLMSMV